MTEDIMTQEAEVNETQKYLDQIKNLKASTVSREEYDKVRNENKTLLETIVNGQSGFERSSTEDAPEGPTLQELINSTYGKDSDKLNDLEYTTNVLEIRDRLLERDGVDHFIPSGKKYSPDYNDQFVAQKVYEGLRHCVDVAEGNNEVFIQEVTRITADSRMPNIIKRK